MISLQNLKNNQSTSNTRIVKVQIFRPAKRFFISNHDIGVVDIFLCFSILSGIYTKASVQFGIGIFSGKYTHSYIGHNGDGAKICARASPKGKQRARMASSPAMENNTVEEKQPHVGNDNGDHLADANNIFRVCNVILKLSPGLRDIACFALYRPDIAFCFVSY